jgi:hypothetical protein
MEDNSTGRTCSTHERLSSHIHLGLTKWCLSLTVYNRNSVKLFHVTLLPKFAFWGTILVFQSVIAIPSFMLIVYLLSLNIDSRLNLLQQLTEIYMDESEATYSFCFSCREFNIEWCERMVSLVNLKNTWRRRVVAYFRVPSRDSREQKQRKPCQDNGMQVGSVNQRRQLAQWLVSN